MQEYPTLVFYDGECGLCNRFVRFLLLQDVQARFRFAPLQGKLARRILEPEGIDPTELDALVVIADWQSDAQKVFVQSGAVFQALRQLGLGWRVLSTIGRVVPAAIADMAYRAVARRRYALFGKADVCELPASDWRSRFVD